jgi:hypothetical protein
MTAANIKRPVLPEVLRHALVAMVRAMSGPPSSPRGAMLYVGSGHAGRGYTNAPGWSADVTAALWRGDITEARRVLRSFGRVSIAPFADPQAVHALTLALDAAFEVVEAHAAALAEDTHMDALLTLVAWDADGDVSR